MKTDKMPDLVHAVSQLEQWHYKNHGSNPKTELYWAQKAHFLSTLVLLDVQDRANGESAEAPGEP